MAFWNKFLKKQEKEESKDAAPVSNSKIEKPLRSAAPSQSPSARKTQGVLVKAHMTEKTNNAARENKYVFAVAKHANKKAVKEAVEERYKVKVEYVNIINLPYKMRTRGKQIGWKPGLKKAVVAIKEGQTIEST